MQPSRVAQQYQQMYREMDFERARLFEAVSEKYRITAALYPGSGIHITPSFYFQHVVYVDRSEAARGFFSDLETVTAYILQNRRYPQAPYIRFLDGDFTEALPLRPGGYDLLIALFAEKVIRSCDAYVAPGGLILTNDYHGEGMSGVTDAAYTVEAVIRPSGKGYRLAPYSVDLLEGIRAKAPPKKGKDGLVRTGGGFRYRDSGYYLLLRKG